MKNGFTYQGAEAELLGGSFGRGSGSPCSAGGQTGGASGYVAAQGVHDERLAAEFAGQCRRASTAISAGATDATEVHLVAAGAPRPSSASPRRRRSNCSTLNDRDDLTTPQTTKKDVVMFGAQRQVRRSTMTGRCRATSMCAVSSRPTSTATPPISSGAATAPVCNSTTTCAWRMTAFRGRTR